VIPDAAVEAALEAFYANCDIDFDGLAAVKAALEAAAPFMLAGVESIAARLERSNQCEDREIAEDLRAALGFTK